MYMWAKGRKRNQCYCLLHLINAPLFLYNAAWKDLGIHVNSEDPQPLKSHSSLTCGSVIIIYYLWIRTDLSPQTAMLTEHLDGTGAVDIVDNET